MNFFTGHGFWTSHHPGVDIDNTFQRRKCHEKTNFVRSVGCVLGAHAGADGDGGGGYHSGRLGWYIY